MLWNVKTQAPLISTAMAIHKQTKHTEQEDIIPVCRSASPLRYYVINEFIYNIQATVSRAGIAGSIDSYYSTVSLTHSL